MFRCLFQAFVQMLLAMIALEWLASCVHAEEISDIAALLKIVRECESRFDQASIEMNTFYWTEATAERPISSDSRRVVQWGDYFYETLHKNDFSGQLDLSAFKFIWCDGMTLTIYSPPERVERYTGTFGSPERFQPYSVLLRLLGWEGTLSAFLQESERPSLGSMQVEITGKGTVGEFETLDVRGVVRLPGSPYAQIISLRLAVDHGYLPCWGEFSEIDGKNAYSKVVATVPSFAEFDAGQSMMREVRATTWADRSNANPTSWDLVQLRGTRLQQQPADGVFTPTEFLGNPKVVDYVDGVSMGEHFYRPKVVKRAAPKSPLYIWVIVDVVTSCGFVVIYSLILLKSVVSREFIRSLVWPRTVSQ